VLVTYLTLHCSEISIGGARARYFNCNLRQKREMMSGEGQAARNQNHDLSQRRKPVRTVELVNVCIFTPILEVDVAEDDLARGLLVESCQCTTTAD
jgi:hypothetical protein